MSCYPFAAGDGDLALQSMSELTNATRGIDGGAGIDLNLRNTNITIVEYTILRRDTPMPPALPPPNPLCPHQVMRHMTASLPRLWLS